MWRVLLSSLLLLLVAGGCGVSESAFRKFQSETESRLAELNHSQTATRQELQAVRNEMQAIRASGEKSAADLKTQVAANRDSIGSLDSRQRQLDSRVSSEVRSRLNEDEGLRTAVADERTSRMQMAEQVRDKSARTDYVLTQIRRVFVDFLVAERAMMLRFLETKRMIQDLQERGVLSSEEIEASKTLSIEDGVWAGQIEALKKLIEAIEPSD